MSNTLSTNYLIIGAGPCGLGAAYRLKDLGRDDWMIVEKSPWVGGLSASFRDPQGFTWDIGGHVQFSHYTYFDRVMDEALGVDGWLHHQRESWVWIHDRFLPYPFQNNIRFLPREQMWKCVQGIIDVTNRPAPTPANFHEWILSIFGRGIADEFMLPYNSKVWAYPPAELAYHWIGERVSVVDLRRVLENILFEKDDVSWGPNNTFRFPKFGGTGAIWSSVGNRLGMEKIHLNTSVTRINPARKEVTLGDGRVVRYTNLLSTIPLDLSAPLVEDLPLQVQQRAQELTHSSSHIVGIGVRGTPKPELEPKCWMYFPESNCPFYRVTLFSKYSPNNVPDITKYFSLMAETSESPGKAVDGTRIVEETLQGLLNTKLISSPAQVVSTWHLRVEHGYPTPSLRRDEILKVVMPALETLGVSSRGRFGAWQYEVSNQDHTFMQGVEWVNWKERGEPESTFKLRA